jgi:hypothetical protein
MPTLEFHWFLLKSKVARKEIFAFNEREIAILVLRCQGLFGAAFEH